MSEWQRARVKIIHDRKPISSLNPEERAVEVKKAEARIFRCRPVNPTIFTLMQAKLIGCDAERFYEILAADCVGIQYSGVVPVVCEHEILTD